jgi:hypothetical protein
MSEVHAFGLTAMLTLGVGVDTRAPGGAVTVSLCGHWDHDGRCRWPHYSEIDAAAEPARLRTLVVAPVVDQEEVVRRVKENLASDPRWHVISFMVDELTPEERAHAQHIA